MHTGARAREQKYIYIYLYISLYENLFENGCVYRYIYIYIYGDTCGRGSSNDVNGYENVT